MMTAVRENPGWRSRWRSRVVLPLPRNPVRTETGSGSAFIVRRGLGEGSARIAFNNPDLRTGGANQPERFDDQATVDADHCEHDAEQEAQAEARQQETAEIVADVFQREVHVTTRCARAPRGPRA